VQTSMRTVRVEDNFKYDAALKLSSREEASAEPLSSSYSQPPVTLC
jgi:hypothetical protein